MDYSVIVKTALKLPGILNTARHVIKEDVFNRLTALKNPMKVLRNPGEFLDGMYGPGIKFLRNPNKERAAYQALKGDAAEHYMNETVRGLTNIAGTGSFLGSVGLLGLYGLSGGSGSPKSPVVASASVPSPADNTLPVAALAAGTTGLGVMALRRQRRLQNLMRMAMR